jgi:hypothetical protein
MPNSTNNVKLPLLFRQSWACLGTSGHTGPESSTDMNSRIAGATSNELAGKANFGSTRNDRLRRQWTPV